MMEQEKRPYVGYEYKKITVAEENASWYLDCYESFGWEQDDNAPPISGGHMVARYRELIADADTVLLANIGHYPQVEAPVQVLKHYLAFREGIESNQDRLWELAYAGAGLPAMRVPR